MKNLFLLLFTVLVLSGCGNDAPVAKDGMTMAIKEGTLTNGGATVILKNESNETVVFTSFFHLERKEGGKWQGLPYTIDESIVAWEEIAYPLGGEYENELELAIEWEWLYGTLDEGEYRLTKNYFLHDDYEKEFTVSVEFELE